MNPYACACTEQEGPNHPDHSYSMNSTRLSTSREVFGRNGARSRGVRSTVPAGRVSVISTADDRPTIGTVCQGEDCGRFTSMDFLYSHGMP